MEASDSARLSVNPTEKLAKYLFTVSLLVHYLMNDISLSGA